MTRKEAKERIEDSICGLVRDSVYDYDLRTIIETESLLIYVVHGIKLNDEEKSFIKGRIEYREKHNLL